MSIPGQTKTSLPHRKVWSASLPTSQGHVSSPPVGAGSAAATVGLSVGAAVGLRVGSPVSVGIHSIAPVYQSPWS